MMYQSFCHISPAINLVVLLNFNTSASSYLITNCIIEVCHEKLCELLSTIFLTYSYIIFSSSDIYVIKYNVMHFSGLYKINHFQRKGEYLGLIIYEVPLNSTMLLTSSFLEKNISLTD